MKYIELFWNRLYYCIFNCDKKTQTLLNRFFECLFYYLKFYRNRKGNNTRIPYNETVGIGSVNRAVTQFCLHYLNNYPNMIEII